MWLGKFSLVENIFDNWILFFNLEKLGNFCLKLAFCCWNFSRWVVSCAQWRGPSFYGLYWTSCVSSYDSYKMGLWLGMNCDVSLAGALVLIFFPGLALRMIQSISSDVHLSVYAQLTRLNKARVILQTFVSPNQPLGRFGLVVAMSMYVYIYIYVPFPCNFEFLLYIYINIFFKGIFWYRCFYPHRSKDLMSLVCGTFTN